MGMSKDLPDNPRWKKRPAGSTWGDWGPDDELGRLNLVTPEKVLQGIAEVKTGSNFCLSLPLDYPGGNIINPRRNPPVLSPTRRSENRSNMNFPLRCDDPTALDVVSDDQVLLTLQYSTQWDTLAHVGQYFDLEGNGKPVDCYYNGFRAGTDIVGPVIYRDGLEIPCDQPQGARHLGVENIAETCVQGRGVMIDLEAHFGRSGKVVGYEDLMSVLEKDKVVIEPGDFVCLRTGFAQLLLEMKKKPDPAVLFATTSALDGRDERLQQWVTDSQLVSLFADNYAVEAAPARPCAEPYCASLPLHAHCLFKLGVYLGEMWYMTELADWLREHGRNRFLLTAPPLRLPGAVGSPATPVATV